MNSKFLMSDSVYLLKHKIIENFYYFKELQNLKGLEPLSLRASKGEEAIFNMSDRILDHFKDSMNVFFDFATEEIWLQTKINLFFSDRELRLTADFKVNKGLFLNQVFKKIAVFGMMILVESLPEALKLNFLIKETDISVMEAGRTEPRYLAIADSAYFSALLRQ